MDTISLGMLRVSGIIELKSVLDYSSCEEVNERAEVRICGRPKKEKVEELKNKYLAGGRLITEYYSDSQYHPLFFSMIETVSFDELHNLIHIKCKGLENLIDVIKSTQSFQNTQSTYLDVIKEVIKDRGVIKCHNESENMLQAPIIRFQETEWEFIRRLAGYTNTIVYPISTVPKLVLAFGLHKQTNKELEQIMKETIVMERIKYLTAKKRYSREVFISKIIISAQFLELGDKLSYQNKSWYVMKKEAFTDDFLLLFKYTLGQPDAYKLNRYGNEQITGCSLRGKVMDAENEKIKLQFDIEKKHQPYSYFYPYKPATGNIMYSMPEIGELVDLYFPNEFEENAFIIHGIKKVEPLREKNKFLRTPDDKSLDLSSDGILIKGGKAAKENLSVIGLTDNSGISMQTSQDIKLKAKGKIKLKAGLSSLIRAQNFIILRQNNTMNQISISGNDIISEAENYRILPRKRKNKIGAEKLPQRIAFQGIENNLSLLGAFSMGNSSSLEQSVMAAIPVCTFPQNPQIQNSLGLHGGGRR